MRTQLGLTLIELLVAMALFAITVTVAVPNFMDFIRNNKVVSHTNELVGTLNMARSEAIKRRATVSLCGSTNGTACNSAEWERGWIVFVDANANATVDSGEEILIVSRGLSAGITLRSISFAANTSVKYTSRGAIDSDGSFKVCDSRGALYAKAITVNLSGRVRLATDTNANTIVNDVDGSDVTCP